MVENLDKMFSSRILYIYQSIKLIVVKQSIVKKIKNENLPIYTTSDLK